MCILDYFQKVLLLTANFSRILQYKIKKVKKLKKLVNFRIKCGIIWCMSRHFIILKPIAAVVVLAVGAAAVAQDAVGGGGRQTGAGTRFENTDAPEFKEKGWLFGRPSKGNADEQFAHAAALEEAGSRRSATRAYNAIVSEWGTSEVAKKAQLKVAEMYVKRGRMLDAFKEYQYFIEMFASTGDADFKTAIAQQYAIANTEMGRLDKGFWSSSDAETVADMFRKIIANAPDWEKAPECQFKRGAAYEHDKKWFEAAMAYEALVSRYPAATQRTDALYRAALARVKLSDKSPRDERTLKNAINALRVAYSADFNHGSAADVEKHYKRLTSALIKMNFEKAEFYDKIRKMPDSAIIAYRAFAKEFKGSPEAERALERIGELEKSRKIEK